MTSMSSSSSGGPAYERNRDPILEVLRTVLRGRAARVFEIGSGSGHHAMYFAKHLPFLHWTTSDRLENHETIKATLAEEKRPNVFGPFEFEVGKVSVTLADYDVVFSANTLHIMSEAHVKTLIRFLGHQLQPGAQVLFYGPFNDGARFTSESNATFDAWLKSVDPQRGIRSQQDIELWMTAAGFETKAHFDMPSNNRILHFSK